MGVVAVPTTIPQAGVPDMDVILKARRSMAGCGGCLDAERGMGMGLMEDYTGTGEEYPAQVAPIGYGDSWLKDVTRGAISITSAILTPPVYRQTGPGGTTEIRTGSAVNYPGPGSGPTSIPIAGVGTNTVLLLGLAAMALFVMTRR